MQKAYQASLEKVFTFSCTSVYQKIMILKFQAPTIVYGHIDTLINYDLSLNE